MKKSWQFSASRKDNGEIMGNTDKKEIYKTATEKFREVNNAYEHIKDIRGMK